MPTCAAGCVLHHPHAHKAGVPLTDVVEQVRICGKGSIPAQQNSQLWHLFDGSFRWQNRNKTKVKTPDDIWQ